MSKGKGFHWISPSLNIPNILFFPSEFVIMCAEVSAKSTLINLNFHYFVAALEAAVKSIERINVFMALPAVWPHV